MPITLDGTNGITTPTYGGADTSEYLVPVTAFKNRIINGAMQIDQRNAGASLTITNISTNTYTLDRWAVYGSIASKFSIQQNAGSVTPPVGFRNYLGATSLSSYTVGAGEYYYVGQYIEGFNCSDLNFGTANASTVTLSFWVRSSVTGTFSGSLTNGAFNRSYPFTYTINASNTWEQKSITVAGDTSGTWLTNNGNGLAVYFDIGSGSNNRGTAGSWANGSLVGATGSQSIIATNGATFYITGVQLEVGSTATSFDYRPYGTELALCQRYYYKVAPSVGNPFGSCAVNATNAAEVSIYFPVTMRTTPTALEQSGTANQYAVYTGGGVNASNAVPTFNWASQHIGVPQFNFASVLTVGRAGTAYAATSNGGYLAWSAEL